MFALDDRLLQYPLLLATLWKLRKKIFNSYETYWGYFQHSVKADLFLEA